MAEEEKVKYPRHVQPDPNVGAVLVRNAEEEKLIVDQLNANIQKGKDEVARQAADAKKAEDDATVAEARRIQAERKGQ